MRFFGWYDFADFRFATVYAADFVVVVVFPIFDDGFEFSDEVLDFGVGPLVN